MLFVVSIGDTEEDVNNFLLEHSETVNTDILKALRKILRLKRNQIRRQMAEKLIAMEGNLLVNFNWKVNVRAVLFRWWSATATTFFAESRYVRWSLSCEFDRKLANGELPWRWIRTS